MNILFDLELSNIHCYPKQHMQVVSQECNQFRKTNSKEKGKNVYSSPLYLRQALIYEKMNKSLIN